MLTSELIMPRLKKRGKTVTPLALPTDYHFLTIANDLIQIFKKLVGHSRGELEQTLHDYEGENLDYPIISGLAHTLVNNSIFGHQSIVSPAQLRAALFKKGPIIQTSDPKAFTREQAIVETATQFSITPEQVEQSLFADLIEERILLGMKYLLTPVNLIARYNLDVARGVLYWAREVDILVRDSYKLLFKYIKLFKLMHTIYPIPYQGYNIILHGPISPFVKSTIRYGVQFAKFLPALLLAQTWRMDAEIHLPNQTSPSHYSLDNSTTLHSHFKGVELFDSELEADFANEFETKYGQVERNWLLTREDEVITIGDTVIIPDFSLTHRKDGRRALIEIVGFWHPIYLHHKLQKIRQANRKDLILIVFKSASVADPVFKESAAGEVLFFTQKVVLKDVLAAVEKCAVVQTRLTDN
jgi:predicted nuclease of restriction endonuclease-like RecB superfamily